jgi:hypothetical protein
MFNKKSLWSLLALFCFNNANLANTKKTTQMTWHNFLFLQRGFCSSAFCVAASFRFQLFSNPRTVLARSLRRNFCLPTCGLLSGDLCVWKGEWFRVIFDAFWRGLIEKVEFFGEKYIVRCLWSWNFWCGNFECEKRYWWKFECEKFVCWILSGLKIFVAGICWGNFGYGIF